MGGDWTRPMWVLLLFLLAGPAQAICPARCRCNEDALRVSCASASLEVVPIQLNPEVRHIFLSDNKIVNVHFTFNFYSNLISLDLSANKIQTLGSSNFESQRNLKYLNLSSNEVESLSKDSFKGLRALTELDLSFNRLEEVSAHAFRDLHSLEVLKLAGNQLVRLEEGLLKPATMLRELLLEDNQLLEIPSAAISDSVNLQRLSLSRNLIASINEGEMPILADLQTLLLDSNVLNEIHAGALSGLSALEHLDLSDNNFTTVPTVPLAKLSNLTKLRFSGNFISNVPAVAFRGLFQLRFLHLDRQEFLTRIDSRALVDNINVERIWLDDNIALQDIPSRLFYGNPKVTHISVRNNQICSIEASNFPLDQLRWLKLGGNPIQCNCSLLWLWKLEQEQKNRNSVNDSAANDLSIDIDDIRCAGPEPLAGMLLSEASETQMGCSLGWIATITAISLTCLILSTTVALLYCGPMKRRSKKSELPPIESMSSLQNGPTLTLTYEDPRVDKYIMGPPLIHEYRALPPWDPYSKDCTDVYRQFDKTRPHIVYV